MVRRASWFDSNVHQTLSKIAMLALAAAFAWALAEGTAIADTISTLNPIADAMVSSANPTTNYGGAGGLSIAAGGLAKGEFQSLLRFDTSAAKASFDAAYGAGNWSISAVALQLTATSPGNAVFNSPATAGKFAASWMQNDSWAEGTGSPQAPTTNGVAYSTLSSFLGTGDESLGGSFNYNGATSGTTTYSLALPTGFLADAKAGNLLSMRLFAADSTINEVCNSVNFPTAAFRPALSITAVPEPGSLTLLAVAGACTVAGLRRGKTASRRTGSIETRSLPSCSYRRFGRLLRTWWNLHN